MVTHCCKLKCFLSRKMQRVQRRLLQSSSLCSVPIKIKENGEMISLQEGWMKVFSNGKELIVSMDKNLYLCKNYFVASIDIIRDDVDVTGFGEQYKRSISGFKSVDVKIKAMDFYPLDKNVDMSAFLNSESVRKVSEEIESFVLADKISRKFYFKENNDGI
jgi:hypothetical protein